jgi:hypothetical protein
MSYYCEHFLSLEYICGYHGYSTLGFAYLLQVVRQGHILYVKDESVNLNTLMIALINSISYVLVILPEPYFTSCFGYAM